MQRIRTGTIAQESYDAGRQAIADLVHKSVVAPARLAPEDLQAIVDAYGVGGAMEIVAVLGSFHFINRIADLVGIEGDLPLLTQKSRLLTAIGVRVQGWGLRMLDLSNQAVSVDVDAALADAEHAFGALAPGWSAACEAPNVAGFLTTVARVRAQLDDAMVERITAMVAEALPACEDDVKGLSHERPADPLDELAFVGTRYAVRTTDSLIQRVRDAYGYDDPELTDVFYAIAMRNGFERMERLLTRVPAAAAALPA